MFNCHLTSINLRLRSSQRAQHAEKMSPHNEQTGKPTNKGLQEQTSSTWIKVRKDGQVEHFRASR